MKISEAKAQIRAVESALSLTQIAFADVLAGRVEWFGRAPFRVGVTRPAGAAGGVIVENHNGAVCVEYASDYFPHREQHIATFATGVADDYNRELLSRRSVMESAKAYLNRAQAAA